MAGSCDTGLLTLKGTLSATAECALRVPNDKRQKEQWGVSVCVRTGRGALGDRLQASYIWRACQIAELGTMGPWWDQKT